MGTGGGLRTATRFLVQLASRGLAEQGAAGVILVWMAKDTYICPSCDSVVEVGGVCPGCGPPVPRARRKRRAVVVPRKSWEQDESLDGLDLPDGGFDYDTFVEREFGKTPHRRLGIKWYWWVTGVVVLGWFSWLVLRGLW